MIYLLVFSMGVACLCLWLIVKNVKLRKSVLIALDDAESKESVKDVLGSEKNIEKQIEMERLSIVAKQTDNAIMIMDPQGNIQWINDGFTRLYEYTFDEFIENRGSNILQTSFNPLVRACIEECLSTRKPAYYEAINETPSGKRIWTHTSLSPVLNQQGEIIHLVAVDSDISKRKEAGDALVRRVDSLTSKISELSIQQSSLTNYTDDLIKEVSNSNVKINETNQIVKFIHDMSDKIKIMGLNASIEAQSVGDTGNGFRVISKEIVEMSDVTKRYSREISEIIKHIQDSSAQLNNGKSMVEQASEKYLQTVQELKQEVNFVEDVVAELN